jgi:hypothetical protein
MILISKAKKNNLLECNAMYCGRSAPTVWRNAQPPSSGELICGPEQESFVTWRNWEQEAVHPSGLMANFCWTTSSRR